MLSVGVASSSLIVPVAVAVSPPARAMVIVSFASSRLSLHTVTETVSLPSVLDQVPLALTKSTPCVHAAPPVAVPLDVEYVPLIAEPPPL